MTDLSNKSYLPLALSLGTFYGYRTVKNVISISYEFINLILIGVVNGCVDSLSKADNSNIFEESKVKELIQEEVSVSNRDKDRGFIKEISDEIIEKYNNCYEFYSKIDVSLKKQDNISEGFINFPGSEKDVMSNYVWQKLVKNDEHATTVTKINKISAATNAVGGTLLKFTYNLSVVLGNYIGDIASKCGKFLDNKGFISDAKEKLKPAASFMISGSILSYFILKNLAQIGFSLIDLAVIATVGLVDGIISQDKSNLNNNNSALKILLGSTEGKEIAENKFEPGDISFKNSEVKLKEIADELNNDTNTKTTFKRVLKDLNTSYNNAYDSIAKQDILINEKGIGERIKSAPVLVGSPIKIIDMSLRKLLVNTLGNKAINNVDKVSSAVTAFKATTSKLAYNLFHNAGDVLAKSVNNCAKSIWQEKVSNSRSNLEIDSAKKFT